jgi:hypothetical protein
LGGIFTSTWTFPSFSYLWTPAVAIFQKSDVLLVTKAIARDECDRNEQEQEEPMATSLGGPLDVHGISPSLTHIAGPEADAPPTIVDSPRRSP